jgi:hypothetical protein
MSKFTYKTVDGLYDVEKLTDTAKIAFNYLAEIQAEVQVLTKRTDILNAAASSYNNLIQEHLDDEALIDEQEEEAVES